jgi:hypothetical protein
MALAHVMLTAIQKLLIDGPTRKTRSRRTQVHQQTASPVVSLEPVAPMAPPPKRNRPEGGCWPGADGALWSGLLEGGIEPETAAKCMTELAERGLLPEKMAGAGAVLEGLDIRRSGMTSGGRRRTRAAVGGTESPWTVSWTVRSLGLKAVIEYECEGR